MTKEYSILDMEYAYIAGIVDGEGCISTMPASHCHNLMVAVVNNNDQVLRFVQEAFGGKIYKRKHIATYDWHISGKAAAVVLQRLYPYLIIKRELAVLGINLMDAAIEERCDIASKMREINTPNTRKGGT